MTNAVTQVPAAPAELAIAHFEAEFTFETDCWDVNDAMTKGNPGFVLVDVRSHAAYARGHVPGAVSIPHGKLIESRLAEYHATLCSSSTAPVRIAMARRAARYDSRSSVVPSSSWSVVLLAGWTRDLSSTQRGCGLAARSGYRSMPSSCISDPQSP